MKTHIFRLHPGDDLKQSLIEFAKQNHITAGYMVTCVGSLSTATLRLAKDLEVKTFADTFEIVSLVGTVSAGRTHLHIAVSDKTGATIGGHLMDGCLIHTTAEIVLGEFDSLEYFKEPDKETGFDELGIRQIHD